MERLTRKERILAAIRERTLHLELSDPANGLRSLAIQELSALTEISSNNVSMELNRLYEEGKLIRISGRPVYYLAAEEAEKRLGRRIPCSQFDGRDAFCSFVAGDARDAEAQPTPRHAPDGAQASRFDELIGGRQSLSQVIRQAKAAMSYPPHGLHTLITGPTGVGKSLFAQCMYDYALGTGLLIPEAKLITLNCANYAENPQLLLSLLFGHVKGAYTGAGQEKKGMVEYAHHGVLFLDEIHRLNPEGQEKLFRLMDYGKFSRLGETDKEHDAQVLIIGATTENTPQSMLSTFLRRIPAHIALPALNARSLEERLELILFYFWKESRNIRTRIELDPEIVNALCFYNCPANIGQLAMDIKISCSNAYFGHLSEPHRNVLIKVHHLNSKIIEGLFVSTNNTSVLVLRLLRAPDRPIVVDGTLEFQSVCAEYLNI